MKSKKILSLFLVATLLFTCLSTTSFASDSNSGFSTMKKLSKQEIVQLTKDISVNNPKNIYSSVPSVTSPYAIGSVNDEIINAGLERINAYRKLAGLRDITLASEYTNYAQTGAMLLAANNELSHYPDRPSDMSNDLYKTGYTGTSSSNIAYFYGYNPASGPLAFSVDLWMEDSDSYNIDRLGHRRWILNPAMGATGLGVADNNNYFYTTLYAFDSSVRADDYDFISWPPSGYMVNDTEFFTNYHAWNISLNPQKFNTRSLSGVTVEMESKDKKYSFSASSDDGYFNIDTGGYGISNAIIFMPEGIKTYEGEYKITVNGLKNYDGTATTLTYTVNFFSSDDADDKEVDDKEEDIENSILTGDVNNDGTVDAGDAVLISRYDAGFITLTETQLEASDVNDDGTVDAGDAVLISRYDAGFISSLT